jgi:UDP-N-acetylmuramate--alanine ligase
MLNYTSFYLVGIKGVALTALAQCLLDAGKRVRGSDVAEDFVTKELLANRNLEIDIGFEIEIPSDVECVIYTAAHQGQFNPQVKQAQTKGLPTLSHAEALGELFNRKKGIAVCGVGGKSTTSAMIAWILEKTGHSPSFAIGVGNIPGLEKTGQWSADSEYFVAEADEYVTDPSAPSRGEAITPRFSFLKPYVTVCTNLKFDHPDVYRDFEHTKETYQTFFDQIKEGGVVVTNAEDHLRSSTTILTFGENGADFQLTNYQAKEGLTTGSLTFNNQSFDLELQIPGHFNLLNAVAAVAASQVIDIDLDEAVGALKTFRSTKRRSEFIGEKQGVKYYDDYAHHPNEVKSVIQAFKEWFPEQRLVVAFQSHTFSRTKALFNDFIEAFEQADEVVMIDIFASAREAFDESVTSDMLCQAIQDRYPQIQAQNVKTIEALAEYLQTKLKPGDVCLTVGAGDIYQVHSHITN